MNNMLIRRVTLEIQFYLPLIYAVLCNTIFEVAFLLPRCINQYFFFCGKFMQPGDQNKKAGEYNKGLFENFF